MKVVHLMGQLRPSGMERMFLSAAAHLHASAKSVIVGQGSVHPFAMELSAAGYRVETLAPIKSLAGTKQWVELLRQEQPDVVHIHTEGAFALAVLAAKYALPKTPIIRTVHSVFAPKGKAHLSRKAQGRSADRFVSQFIAVSPDVQVNEQGYGREAKLIFNWVDSRFYEARNRRNQSVELAAVIVGNPSPIKNHILALKALRKTDHVLYYHGDETHASAEEVAILDELQAAGRLRYRGTGEPTRSLELGSLFLLPSKHEGMCIALAEALVVGVPALVNDALGVQWSRGFPNVIMLSDDQRVWDQALACHDLNGVHVHEHDDELPVDLSVTRGARELIETYRMVTD